MKYNQHILKCIKLKCPALSIFRYVYVRITTIQVKILNISIAFRVLSCLFLISPPSLHPHRSNLYSDFYHHQLVLPVFELHVKGSSIYSFISGFLLLFIILGRVTHVVACISSLFWFFVMECSMYALIYFSFSSIILFRSGILLGHRAAITFLRNGAFRNKERS